MKAQCWTIQEDQWGETYYELREDGKLYFVAIDRKEQQETEYEQDIPTIIEKYKNSENPQLLRMVDYLKKLG